MSNHFLFSDVLFTTAVIIFSGGVGLAVGLIWEIGHQTKLDRQRIAHYEGKEAGTMVPDEEPAYVPLDHWAALEEVRAKRRDGRLLISSQINPPQDVNS